MAFVNIEFNPEDFVITRETCNYPEYYDTLPDNVKTLKYKNIIAKHRDFVYESWDGNSLMVHGYEFINYDYNDPDVVCWPPFDDTPVKMRYGVCDNIDQIFERDPYIDAFKKSKKDYVIVIHWIPKENNGGWRWHKWGTYIGDFEHNCEYLSEETTPGLEGVWCYNIQQVTKK